jgi:hypothetical protein
LKKEITEVKHEQQKTDKQGYTIGVQLTEQQTNQLKMLLKQYEDIMATTFEDIRVSPPKYYHDIDTGDAKPIKSRPYQVPQAHREWQRKENKRLEESGVTRPSQSEWGFPCVLAPKKGSKPGEFAPRQCHDYRKLNDVTKTDAHPLPLIDDILSTLEPGAKYLSVVDMFSGYFQIGMTPRATERSAFVTAEGHWEYL